MMEELEMAREELMRLDHLIYVSLKYTKTVDVFKHIIRRFLNAYEFLNEALLLHCKNLKKIKEIPSTPGTKRDTLMELFEGDNIVIEHVMFYTKLRKIDKAEYTRSREYRRHVAMTVNVEGEEIEINIDKFYERYEKLKDFYEYVLGMIEGKEE